MATLDEILDTMPDEAEDVHGFLIIDAAARRILVPEAEAIFGVENDREAERKYFRCPRYVGDDLDLADMFLTVYFRNANGDEDGYLVDDVAVDGDDITFSWLLSEKVTAFPGEIQFAVCAARSKDGEDPDWNTTLASGTVLEGLHADPGDVEEQTSDVVTQLREEIKNSTAAVEAAGATQIDAVEAAGANATQAAKDAVKAQGAATLATIPEDYTALANTVGKLTRDRAAAIVCEAEGTAIQVNDASNDPLIGLRILGRSTQNGTPTPDAPVDIVSLAAPVVTVSDGSGGNVQTLTVTTPDGLPGIPVASGGNYTDANGQQWIADEVDLARGVYVQKVKKFVLADLKTETWYTWGVNHSTAGITGFYHYFTDDVVNDMVLSNIGDYSKKTWGGVGTGVNASADGNYFMVSVANVNLSDISTDEKATASFIAMLEATGAYIMAAVTPIEHALTDAELQAWRALHSVKPITTVLNDVGAHMTLEYAADPKTYIDNKLAALVAGN